MYELAILARGGVLLTIWALAAGWPPGRLAARLRRDGWQRICRGAWAVPGKETDWRVRETALQLLRPQYVCRHGTAARLHRIEVLAGVGTGTWAGTWTGAGVGWDRPGRPGPTTGAGSSERVGSPTGTGSPDGVGRLTGAGSSDRVGRPTGAGSRASLPAGDVCLRRGLRVTTAARTAADLIRASGSREEAVVTADSALSRRVVEGVRRDPPVRYEELAAQLSVRRPGAPRARAWLRLADPAAGSPAETVARLRMADAALFPESQPLLRTPAGRPLHPDFLFRAAGLAVEVEGYAYHGTPRAHERDIARFNALQSCPEVRRVLRFTAREVFTRPDRMTATVRKALEELGTAVRAT
ncbi:endonuclease domain-containing protein [Streptomyces hydrogenans]|uniref:endonuclease domain-containing protein n=1 Tax=Streptomyces hydrogenans TaxID=1873719 RepID=UPI0035D7F893